MPSETIVAVFETARAAEAAVAALVDGGVSENAIHRYNDDTAGDPAIAPTGTSTGSSSAIGGTLDEPPAHTGGGGFWSWLTGENADQAHHHGEYDRSIGTGHQVVTVIAQESEAAFVMDILDRHDPLNIEEHGAGAAGAGGLAVPAAGTAATGATASTFSQDTSRPLAGESTSSASIGGAPLTEPMGGPTTTAATGATTPLNQGGPVPVGTGTGTGAGTDREEVLSLSEEQLEVGKRQIDRGTTRIRRYVVERPVEEQIRLRDEAVSVFRRPVAGRSAVGADAFTDRTIEMTETDEEAVVAKKAFVSEEVVLRKDVEERNETVRDTLRKEEVEITGPGSTTASGSVTGSTGFTEPKKDI